LAKILQDIWILESLSGIVLFHRVFDKEMDVHLFGGLMSALNSFAEVLVKEGLSSFELSRKRFAILKRKYYLFIGNSSIKTKEKKLIEELNEIAYKFLKLYNDILESWHGDISIFTDFESEIQNSLKGEISKS